MEMEFQGFSGKSEVAEKSRKVCGAQVFFCVEQVVPRFAVVFDIDRKVQTRSSACGLGKESLSDRSDLQGGGHASVENTSSELLEFGRKCSEVASKPSGSRVHLGLTDCRGVLRNGIISG